MFDYTGYECKSCGKKFGADDDIVVCPECGTPYHRECYLREGKCVNDELHEKHISWKADMESKEQATDNIRCRNCGKDLRGDQLFCDGCGTPTDYFLKTNGAKMPDSAAGSGAGADYSGLYGKKSEGGSEKMSETIYPYMINYSDPLCGFNPDEEYDGQLTTKDLGDFVGTNTHYYLPKFKLMKTGHFKLSMNISALFFPEFYFAYRKMPLIALLVLILKTAVSLPATAMSMQMMFDDAKMLDLFIQTFPALSDAVQRLAEVNFNTSAFNLLYNLSSILNWAVIFVFGSLSNYMYYRYTLKKASKIKREALGQNGNISERLKESGGTSALLMVLFFGLWFVINYAAMGAVFMIV